MTTLKMSIVMFLLLCICIFFFGCSNNHNDLKKEDLAFLKSISILSLEKYHATTLPLIVKNFTNLNSVYLRECDSLDINQAFEVLSVSSNLTIVDISNCKMQAFPENIFKLKKMERLFINDNSLTKIPSTISMLKNIKMIGVDAELSELPKEIGDLKSLHSLDLRGNSFSHFPVQIVALTNLKVLDLMYNSITEFPAEISKMSNLSSLYIGGNPFALKEIEYMTNHKNQHSDAYNNLQKLIPNCSIDLDQPMPH